MSLQKTCTKCSVAKPLESFSPQAKGRYGVTSICKPCTSLRGLAWHKANADRSREAKSVYREKHKAVQSEYARAWRAENAERLKALAAQWTAGNRAKKRAAVAKRRAAKKRAIPPWADLSLINDLYALAATWTSTAGVVVQVDHVVPLQSKLVCGLHCEANLEIVPERLNKSKGNLWWPDMPDSERVLCRPISTGEHS